jgi:hypothetical protein
MISADDTVTGNADEENKLNTEAQHGEIANNHAWADTSEEIAETIYLL